ncbi:hypothetical protein ABZX85_42075 [Streptomyces sp. NPDC004539]|uniref:hypothetical protein n=1 Tax=Streptomyces sp. NPDC004539 TaxID=3154280 RepID=UPI0033AB789E
MPAFRAGTVAFGPRFLTAVRSQGIRVLHRTRPGRHKCGAGVLVRHSRPGCTVALVS